MNTKQLFAAAAIALVGTAVYAQDADQHVPTGSQLSRAEVKAEVMRARDAGELIVASEYAIAYAQPAKAASGLTRAEVRAEVLKARADGNLARPAELETDVSAPVQATSGGRTREEVRAEAIAYTLETHRAGRVESYLQ